MGNFVFFFVLLTSIMFIETKDVVKRSLVSRFTSNPFFLRHFGDDQYENDQLYRPRYFQIDLEPDEYEDAEIFIEPHVRDEISTIPVTEEENIQETVETVFDKRPDFYKTHIFEDKEEATPQHNENNEDIRQETVEIEFNKLPHFEKAQAFKDKEEKEKKLVLYRFKSMPHFYRAVHFRDRSEKPAVNPENGKIPVTYYFRSLPHFEKSEKFHEPTLFLSRSLAQVSTKPSRPRRRKLVRVIRRKKVSSTPEDVDRFSATEFGRRLSPKVTVADLPLENFAKVRQNVRDSYGSFVSSAAL